MKQGWKLIDSRQRAQEFPRTWGHPPEDVRNQIEVGDFVKIGVAVPELQSPTGDRGERFWGVVHRIEGDDYHVIITNDLIEDHGLRDGDPLTVTFDHIFGLMKADGTTIYDNLQAAVERHSNLRVSFRRI